MCWTVFFLQSGGEGSPGFFSHLSSWTFCWLYLMWKSLSSSISPADNISSTRLSNRLSRAEKNMRGWLLFAATSFSLTEICGVLFLPLTSARSQKMQASGYLSGPPSPSPPSCPLCSASQLLWGMPVSSWI